MCFDKCRPAREQKLHTHPQSSAKIIVSIPIPSLLARESQLINMYGLDSAVMKKNELQACKSIKLTDNKMQSISAKSEDSLVNHLSRSPVTTADSLFLAEMHYKCKIQKRSRGKPAGFVPFTTASPPPATFLLILDEGRIQCRSLVTG